MFVVHACVMNKQWKLMLNSIQQMSWESRCQGKIFCVLTDEMLNRKTSSLQLGINPAIADDYVSAKSLHHELLGTRLI